MFNLEDDDPICVDTNKKLLPDEFQLAKPTNDNRKTFKHDGKNIPLNNDSDTSDEASKEGRLSWETFHKQAVQIVSDVQRITNSLCSSVGDERNVAKSLRSDDTGIAQKRKQVKRCKLFEISTLVHSLNGHIISWNVLCERRQTELESSTRCCRFRSLALTISMMNSERKIVTELRFGLLHQLVQSVCQLDKLIQLGLCIMATAGMEKFSISLLQKAVLGIVAFNELLSSVEKRLKDATVTHFIPKPISIKRMLTIVAEERSSKIAKLLYLTLEDQMTKLGIVNRARSGEEYSWSLGVISHPNTRCHLGYVQTTVTSDYGSDSGDCSVLNNVEVGCPMRFPELNLTTLQSVMAQEDLNIARFASVIHLTFIDVQQTGPSSSSPVNCHQQLQLWWAANDQCPHSASSVKTEQGISSLITNFYREILEIKAIDALKSYMECPAPGCIQNTHLLSTGLLLEMGNCALNLCHAAEARLPLLQAYRSLRSHLLITAAIKAWDIGMSDALAATSDPKCLTAILAKDDHGTKAGRLLTRSLEPIVWLELAISHDQNLRVDQTVNSAAFARLLNTLQLTASWLQTTTRNALSAWHVGTFCLVTQGDLKRIIHILKHMVNVNPVQGKASEPCGTVCGQSTVGAREALLWQMILWENINKTVAKIQNCSSNCIKDFCSACSTKIQMELERSMPTGKHWRQRCKRTGIPTERNPYARSLVDSILGPIVEAVCRQTTPTQISILSMATKVFCETWMNHILSKQIKFSLHGAHLLKLDFGHLIDFINSQPMLSIETRQSVMSLEILHQFRGACVLLLRQTEVPGLRMRRRKVAPFRGADSDEPEQIETGHRMESLDGGDSIDSDTVPDEEHVQNKDQWLALRVNATKSVSWPPFWCFT